MLNRKKVLMRERWKQPFLLPTIFVMEKRVSCLFPV